jgi:D-alanyl-D-alanine carboxypeptidase (penicillin-binding protein 5/6)
MVRPSLRVARVRGSWASGNERGGQAARHDAYWWGNSNALIGSYRGADGIKTGYTDAALHCLLFEAVRRGVILIGVVLGSPATGPDAAAQAAARLLNWGFGLKLAPGGPAMAHG